MAEREVRIVRVEAARPAAGTRRPCCTGRCRALPAADTADSRRLRRSARRPRGAARRSRIVGCRTRRRSGIRCAAGPAAPATRQRLGGDSSAYRPRPRARCSRPSTSPSKVSTRAVVVNPSANWSGIITCRRMLARGSLGDIRLLLWLGAEARRQGVAQQHHVTQLPHLSQRARRCCGCQGNCPSPTNRRAAESPTKNGCDGEVQFVGQVAGEELGVHRLAALDHQPPYAAAVEVLAQPVQVDRLAAVDDGRHRAEPLLGLVHACAGAVDHLLGRRPWRRSRPTRPTLPPAVTVTFIGDGGSPRASRSSRRACGADQQPGLVAADGGRADQDGVTAGPDGVDPVEVGRVGQGQRLSRPRSRCSRRSTWRNSARCTDAQPRPPPSGSAARRPRRSQAATSRGAAGEMAASERTP